MGHKPVPDIQRRETRKVQENMDMEPPKVMASYKPDPPNPHDGTTRRLTNVYISRMINSSASWSPNVDSVWQCYEYINDKAVARLNMSVGIDISQGIEREYAEYFLAEDPGHIKSVIGQELSLFKEIRRAAH